MNPRYTIVLFAGLFALVSVEAQTVAPSSAESLKNSAAASDDAITLSPFIVQSEKDTGYQAVNTLAGSRLNTPIKDLGASISVYKKAFLDDIGATNANDLLIYATGTEAAGPGGNFSNGAGNNIQTTQVVGDGSRNDPQGASRTRGLTSPTFTRGFFGSNVPIDSYNASGITVNRGPNAILFGVASPAGVIDTTLVQADTHRNLNRTELRYGDNDSLRESVDFNRVLIPKKLAFRVAALADDDRYDQRPAFESKRRLYGAVTFEPFRTTAIRVNFEMGHSMADRPFAVLPFNSYETWLDENKRTPFDWTYYDDPSRDPNAKRDNSSGYPAGSKVPFRTFAISQFQLFNTLVFPISNPTANGAIGQGFRAQIPVTNLTGTGSLAANAIRNQVFDPVFNKDSAQDNPGFYETGNIAELPAAYYTDGRVPAGIKFQGFTDYSNFDWRHQMIDETGRQSYSFHNYNITFEQRAWQDRIGVEAAFFSEYYISRNRNPFLSSNGNGFHIRIDPNVSLPDGTPNPNVGRPYVDNGQTYISESPRSREAERVTAYLHYDFKDLSPSWGRWLGRHTATLLGERTRSDQLNIVDQLGFYGQYDDFGSADPYSFNRLLRMIAYIGPSVVGNNNPVTFQSIQFPWLQSGTVVNANMPVVAAGDPWQAKFVRIPYTLRQVFNRGSYSRDLIKSRAVNLMSYWADDLVITNVGLRRDDDYFQQFSIPTGVTTAGLANLNHTEWNFDDVVLPRTPPFAAGKQTKTYSVVLRWPQRFLRLPKGSDLSIFNNVSENFTPNGANTDAYGNLLPSPAGHTRETGLNFSFLENRFSIRLNQYETKIQDQNIGRIPALGAIINNGILQTIGYWAQEPNFFPGVSRQADIDALLNATPSNFRQVYQIAYTGSAASQNAGVTYVQLPSYSDTSNFVAKGLEADLIFNPTRNWRILLNFAKNESVQSNIAPVTRELYARLTPVMTQLANRPKANAIPTHVFPRDANGNVTSLDVIPGEQQTLGQFWLASVTVPLTTTLAAEGVSSPEIRKYRVNLVTNYSFDRETILRGWAVGGGLRWQDRVGIGYPTSYNADGSVFVDRANAYYGPAETNVDAWISYGRKIWRNRIDWRIQLNGRNVIGKEQLIPITTQPDGSPASMRLPPDRRWYLTNTFSF